MNGTNNIFLKISKNSGKSNPSMKKKDNYLEITANMPTLVRKLS